MSASISQIVQVTKETIELSAQEVLGERARPVIERIRSAPDTPEGLHEAVTACKAMTQSGMDNRGAEAVDLICAALLRDMDDAVRQSKLKPSSEREALKARITKAKLIAATSSLLGSDAESLVQQLQAAESNRDSIRAAYEECEKLVDRLLSSAEAEQFKERCGKIVQQL